MIPDHIKRIIERIDPADREALEQHFATEENHHKTFLQCLDDNAMVSRERDEFHKHLAHICELVGEVNDGMPDIGAAWESVAALVAMNEKLRANLLEFAETVDFLDEHTHPNIECDAVAHDMRRIANEPNITSLAEVRIAAVKEFANQVFDSLIKNYRQIKIMPLTMAEEYAVKERLGTR